MFIEKEKYFFIDEFEKLSVIAAMSKKELGNMADYVDIGNSFENRASFLKLLGLKEKKIIQVKQGHTNNILYIKKNEDLKNYNNLENFDGFITDRKDVVLFTYYADCLPIYIVDLEKQVIGIAHSGWKGSFSKILKSLTDKFLEIFDSKIENLKLAIGIGIAWEDYEVNLDFYNKFLEIFPNLVSETFKFINNKIFFDNTMFNYLLALELGFIKENIILDNRGVKKANIFSYRIDKEKAGRAAAIISFKDKSK